MQPSDEGRFAIDEVFPEAPGEAMYGFATTLFPICRSLTGKGVRETLNLIQQELGPDLHLSIIEVPSGTRCFDWEVPKEWNINDAYIMDEDGNRIVDFRRNNLHVVSYSIPVDRTMSLKELEPHLFSLPEQPDAIPYVTSYYKEMWGFCLSHQQREKLTDKRYRVKIDSRLEPGYLTIGELLLPGETEQEILLSTYICHPSMGNNETSGPVVTTYLAKWLASKRRYYSYRILFVPETIGSITYISQTLDLLKRRVIAGFQVTCVGDDRAYSFLPSRTGNTLADRVAEHVLSKRAPNFVRYTFLDRGSDERQYCSPGVELPVVSVMRTRYGSYPEYHTSLDDLSLISSTGLGGAWSILVSCLHLLENNKRYQCTYPCEPQLGKRGLYPNLGTKHPQKLVRRMMNLLAYCDGNHDLVQVADRINESAFDLLDIAARLESEGLLKACE